MLERVLHLSLWQQVPRDHRQSPRELRRRQLVTVAVVLVGAAVLAWTLRITPGSSMFYAATLLLPAVWTAGAFASGPLHLGRIADGRARGSEPRGADGADGADGAGGGEPVLARPVLQPILIGLALAAVFVVGGLLVHQVGPLNDAVRRVLDYADQGSGPLLLLVTVINGLSEELFFRGAVYAAIPRRPEVWSTVIYVIATLATGNVMLGFAAVVLGAVVALQRRASGGILAPALTHITWSVVMLYALPAIFF